jgi:membrane protein YdbS with pleckstrin-like domain
MRRRPVKTGWQLLWTVAVLLFPLLFVLAWIEASRFTHHWWQVQPLSVAIWSAVALVVILFAVFIDQRTHRWRVLSVIACIRQLRAGPR